VSKRKRRLRLSRGLPKKPKSFEEAMEEVERECRHGEGGLGFACRHICDRSASEFVKMPTPDGEFVCICEACFSLRPEDSLTVGNLRVVCPGCLEKMTEGMVEIPFEA
jgi:hypothetical protein